MQRQQSFQNNAATLYVIATPIGNLKEISSRVVEALNDVETVFCEDTRVTGQLLSHLNIKKNLISAYENIERQSLQKVLEKHGLLGDNKDVLQNSIENIVAYPDLANELIDLLENDCKYPENPIAVYGLTVVDYHEICRLSYLQSYEFLAMFRRERERTNHTNSKI